MTITAARRGGGSGVAAAGGGGASSSSSPATWHGGVGSQFVVTKHHAYCVVTVRGQALLVKLGGSSNGTHEHMYLDRFPAKVTSMSMCPQDNNIIAFGVPAAEADAAVPPTPRGGAAGGVVPASALHNVPAAPAAAPQLKPPRQRIELVNFAQSARIQTISTLHEGPMLLLDYSPDSSQMISCSADTIQLWAKDPLERRGAGALDEAAAVTLRMPTGTSIHLVKVHPAWTSVLLATNDALEVRSLARATPPAHRHQQASNAADGGGGSAAPLLSPPHLPPLPPPPPPPPPRPCPSPPAHPRRWRPRRRHSSTR